MRYFPKVIYANEPSIEGAFGGGAAGGGAGDGAAGGAAAGAGAGGAAGGGAAAGGEQQAWYGTIPNQAVRDLMQAKAYDTPDKLADAYYHANKALSGAKDVVAIPGEGATPEQQNAFYKTLGRPDAPEQYQFKFADGIQVDEGFKTGAAKFFHEAGVPANMAQKIIDGWQAYIGPRFAQEQAAAGAAITQAVEATKAQMGADFEPARARGGELLKTLGLSAGTMQYFEQNQGAPAVIELIARIGAKMSGEAPLVGGTPGSGGAADYANMSAPQAQAEITRLNADPEFSKAYLDRTNPQHKASVDRMQALYAAAARKAA